MANKTTVYGKIYCSNKDGEGVFSPTKDGYQQHVGTGATPKFTSAKQLGAWVRRHLDIRAARPNF